MEAKAKSRCYYVAIVVVIVVLLVYLFPSTRRYTRLAAAFAVGFVGTVVLVGALGDGASAPISGGGPPAPPASLTEHSLDNSWATGSSTRGGWAPAPASKNRSAAALAPRTRSPLDPADDPVPTSVSGGDGAAAPAPKSTKASVGSRIGTGLQSAGRAAGQGLQSAGRAASQGLDAAGRASESAVQIAENVARSAESVAAVGEMVGELAA